MKKLFILITASPLVALAQTKGVNPGYVNDLITESSSLLRGLVILLISLAVVWFIWNVIRYAMSEDLEKKDTAKSQMIWGIIAIAVMVSIWGLVTILQGIFNVGGETAPVDDINSLIPQAVLVPRQ